MISVLAGIILLTAAALKGHQLLTSPVAGSRLLAALLVVVEWSLGMTLVGGIWPERMRWIAIACFAMFSVVAGYRMWQGSDSCGCFGRVVIRPVYTLTMDLIFLGAFLLHRPNASAATTPRRIALTGGAALITAALWAVGILTYTPSTVDAQGQIVGDGTNIVVVPETWPGKRLPLRSEIPDSDGLIKGDWLVLFYHHDCPDCQEALRTLTSRVPGGELQLAIVEVPPYGDLPADVIKNRIGITSLKLNNERNWFVSTPTLARMKDGVVETVLIQEQVVDKRKPTPEVLKLADKITGKLSSSTPTTASATAPAVHAVKPTTNAVVQDISNLQHDFGDVVVGQTYHFDLVLENPMSERLPITYTRGECKCLVIDRVPTGIPANGTTTVKVSFTPDKPINYSKRIVFLTASKERPTIIFTAKADVKAGPTTQ